MGDDPIKHALPQQRLLHGLGLLALVLLASLANPGTGVTIAAEQAMVPGVVIDHSPAASGIYIGSPSLAVLSKGD